MSPRESGRRRFHRTFFISWLVVVLFIITSLLGNAVSIALSVKPELWLATAASQVAFIGSLFLTYPLPSFIITNVLILFTIVGLYFRSIDLLENKKDQLAIQQERSQVKQDIQILKTTISSKSTLKRSTPINVPRSIIGLIDRQQAVELLTSTLKKDEGIVVCAIEGMGGIGKTAIAARIADTLANDSSFPGGAIWVDCENLKGDNGLETLWIRIANLTESFPQTYGIIPKQIALGRALSEGEKILIVLDNIEVGIDVETIVQALSIPQHTALLLTSRHQLKGTFSTHIIVESLSDDYAQKLFIERLRSTDFNRPTELEKGIIPQLVQLLRGIPLAIELTAAYVGNQRRSLERIVAEVSENSLSADFLNDPQQGVKAQFDRSFNDLTLSQQKTFIGLSFLAGSGFPRDLAIIIAEAVDGNVADVEQLVIMVLIEPIVSERYRLHPSLREYGLARLGILSIGEQDKIGNAMIAYWLTFATLHQDNSQILVLEQEAESLMSSLEWAYSYQQWDIVLEIRDKLSQSWLYRGRYTEARQMYAWAIEAAEKTGNISALIENNLSLAIADVNQGFIEKSEMETIQALTLAEQYNNLPLQRQALHELTIHARSKSKFNEAHALAIRTLEIAQLIGDKSLQRMEMHELAIINWRIGNVSEAILGFENALAQADSLQDDNARREEHHELGFLNYHLKNDEISKMHFTMALALAEKIGDNSAIREELHGLAVLASREGVVNDAKQYFEQAIKISLELGNPWALAIDQRDYGYFHVLQNEYSAGQKLLQSSLTTLKEVKDLEGMALTYQYLGASALRQGNKDEAIRYFQSALESVDGIENPIVANIRKELESLQ